MLKERQIVFYKDYFQKFYLEQSSGVREKIAYVFSIIKTVDKIPDKFFKYIDSTDGIYEIRIESAGNIYRIFCCFDKGNIIVLFNAFHKKTMKTPKQELEKAQKLKNDYYSKK